MSKEELEQLAALEPEQWMSWTMYLAEYHINDISIELLQKWEKNWIPYDQLSEKEKEKDRIWARRVYTLVQSRLEKAIPFFRRD